MDLTDSIAGLSNQVFQFGMAAYSDVKNKKAIRRQNAANKELAKYQYDLQLEQWNRANEYNSPKMQMQRYQDAGLNPNLIYGNGSSSAGMAAQSAPSYERPNVEAVPLGMPNTLNAVSSMLDQALKVSQIKKTAQETANLGVYQHNMRLDADLKELDKIGKAYANSKSKEEAEVWRDMYDWKLLNMRAQGQLMDSQRFATDAKKDATRAELGLIEYRKSLLSAQIADILASADLKRGQIALIPYQISNYIADNELKGVTLKSKEISNFIEQTLISNGIDLKARGKEGLVHKLLYFIGLNHSGKSVPNFTGY